jgi:DNA polymerase III delta prime subunit
MSYIDYHPEINEKLDFFLKSGKIPNIIFHGPSGSGKRTIVNHFISKIYKNNKDLIKNYVMYENCAHGKGIKFIRDDLKFFAKTHISAEGSCKFKTIVLSNADELTSDAQSALRRCIELFSHTTRFFIIVQDKYKLLKPILSRLCEIFINEPIINGTRINLHKYNINNTFKVIHDNKKINITLDKMFAPFKVPDFSNNVSECHYKQIIDIVNILYEKGYSGLDIIKYIEYDTTINNINKYQMLLVFNKLKKEFRNEKLFMLFILNFLLLRCNYDLENISFM